VAPTKDEKMHADNRKHDDTKNDDLKKN